MITVDLDVAHFVIENILCFQYHTPTTTHVWVRGDEEPWSVPLSARVVNIRINRAPEIKCEPGKLR